MKVPRKMDAYVRKLEGENANLQTKLSASEERVLVLEADHEKDENTKQHLSDLLKTFEERVRELEGLLAAAVKNMGGVWVHDSAASWPECKCIECVRREYARAALHKGEAKCGECGGTGLVTYPMNDTEYPCPTCRPSEGPCQDARLKVRP